MRKPLRSRPANPGPVDELTFEACQEALSSAIATVHQWNSPGDPQLKAKLALLVIRHAENGESDPMRLPTRALATYLLESACENSKP